MIFHQIIKRKEEGFKSMNSKESFYFSHDYNAITDPKMMMILKKEGLAGIGLFWILIELLHQQPESSITREELKNYIDFYSKYDQRGLDFLTNVEQCFFDTGLLKEKNNIVYSDRVLKNKEKRDEISKARSYAGKKSAEKRYKKDNNLTNVQQGTFNKLTKERKGKEIKGKEINTPLPPKGDDDFISFWKKYPKKTGKGAALKSWQKQKPPIAQVLETLNWQIYTDQWQRENGQFIPNPATWLNQKRWEDEKSTGPRTSTQGRYIQKSNPLPDLTQAEKKEISESMAKTAGDIVSKLAAAFSLPDCSKDRGGKTGEHTRKETIANSQAVK